MDVTFILSSLDSAAGEAVLLVNAVSHSFAWFGDCSVFTGS